MKAVQVMLDERLLARLDATSEVKQEGRSAVLRRALEDYLRRREKFVIAEGYRAAYGGEASESGLGREFDGWEDESTWPAD